MGVSPGASEEFSPELEWWVTQGHALAGPPSWFAIMREQKVLFGQDGPPEPAPTWKASSSDAHLTTISAAGKLRWAEPSNRAEQPWIDTDDYFVDGNPIDEPRRRERPQTRATAVELGERFARAVYSLHRNHIDTTRVCACCRGVAGDSSCECFGAGYVSGVDAHHTSKPAWSPVDINDCRGRFPSCFETASIVASAWRSLPDWVQTLLWSYYQREQCAPEAVRIAHYLYRLERRLQHPEKRRAA
jgi:hypothetical protein